MRKELTPDEWEELVGKLKKRFAKHMHRHESVDWTKLEAKMRQSPLKMISLHEMENTGGEPDVIGYDVQQEEYIFFDCSKETPKGRTSVCYDHLALESRKKYKPKDSAINMADEMGIRLLTEAEYHLLQQLGEFDTKTSSWLSTPPEIRESGGAIFGDRRYGRVFIFHNGADSYFSSRGFRGSLRI